LKLENQKLNIESLCRETQKRSSKIRNTENDDDDDPKEISPDNNIMIIKNALKLNNSFSSLSEETSNNFIPNNSKYDKKINVN
jgi:hypothetical protein